MDIPTSSQYTRRMYPMMGVREVIFESHLGSDNPHQPCRVFIMNFPHEKL